MANTDIIKVCAVSGDQGVSDELLEAARSILGSGMEGFTLMSDRLTDPQVADVFVCMPTRIEDLTPVVPLEKIVGLELVPSTNFFVQIARIPCDENVTIFHFNERGAKTLLKQCGLAGIDHVKFQIVECGGMAQSEVEQRIQSSQYIIGSEPVVGEGRILHSKYGKHIQSNAKIFPAKRVLAQSAVCQLISWITLFKHQSLVQKVF